MMFDLLTGLLPTNIWVVTAGVVGIVVGSFLNAAEREREAAPEFAKARRRHPAVESAINHLEHCGLDRVRTRGADGFERTVGLSILAANFHRLGLERRIPAQAALNRLNWAENPPR